MRTFALYPIERHWWSFADYGAVIDLVRETAATVMLEFGPGSSTLALIEGGATRIDTCEDDPHWAAVHRSRLVSRFPQQIHLHEYVWASRLTIPAVDAQAYDLALIDGPRDLGRRWAVLKYALDRSAVVVMPVETTKAITTRLQALEKASTHVVAIRETGPLAGAFAVITRKDVA